MFLMKFRQRFMRGCLWLSAALLTLPVYGWTGDDAVEVQPSDDAVSIPIADLLLNDGVALGDVTRFDATQPAYGSLKQIGDVLIYEPSLGALLEASLWSHGTDSFTYSVWSHRKAAPSTATVLLVATRFGVAQFAWDFEDGVVPDLGSSDFVGTVHSDAAYSGDKGLELAFDTSPGSTSKVAAISYESGGGQTTTHTGSGCVTGQPDPFGTITTELIAEGISLLGAGPAEDPFRIRLVLREGFNGYEVRGEALDDSGDVLGTAWWPLSPGPHTYELDWWLPDNGRSAAGFLVRVDGMVVGRRNDVAIGVDFAQSSVIGLSGTTEGSGTLLLDDIILTSGDGETYWPSLPLRLDGFEQGLGGWSNTGFTTAVVEINSAMTGVHALRADLDDPNVPYVTDTTPSDREYGMRFRLDPRAIWLAAGTRVSVFSASSEEPGAGTGHHLWLKLRQDNGQVKLRVQQLTDTPGVYVSSPWLPLPQDPFTVELGWQAATDPHHDNGRLRLWMNGQLAIDLSGLDTSTKVIETVRFGAASVHGAGVRGPLYVDNFESWGPGTPPPTVPPI